MAIHPIPAAPAPAPDKTNEAEFGGPSGAMYADPRSIEHEMAGPAEELVTTKKKGKPVNQVSKQGLLPCCETLLAW